MALATKCPHCNTIFRVAADQLKLRGGIVRCGSCHEVFDGNAALVEPATKPTPVIPEVPLEPAPQPVLAPAPAIAAGYVQGAAVDFELDFAEPEPEPDADVNAEANADATPAPASEPAAIAPIAAAPSVWRTAATPVQAAPPSNPLPWEDADEPLPDDQPLHAASADAEADTPAASDSDPEPELNAHDNADAAFADAYAAADAVAGTSADTDVDAGADAKAGADARSNADDEVDVDTGADARAGAEADANTGADAADHADAGADAMAGADADIDVDAGSDAKSYAEAEAEADFDAGADAMAGANADIDVDAGAAATSYAEADFDAGTAAKAGAEADVDAGADAGAAAEADADADAESDLGVGGGTETDADADGVVDDQAWPGDAGEPGTDDLARAADEESAPADAGHGAPADGRIEPSLDPQEHIVIAALDDAHHFEDLPPDEQLAASPPSPADEPWSLAEPEPGSLHEHEPAPAQAPARDDTALHAVAAVNTDVPDDGESLPADEPDDEDNASTRRAAAEARMRALAGVDETSDQELDHSDLGFVKRHDRSQKYGKAIKITLALGIPLLLAGLVLQAATTFRDTLAANYPQLKPALAAICQPLACKIGLPTQLDALSIEQGELASMADNTFSFSTVLRNQSKTVQAWPHIELTLNDNADKPVLRRVFAPREYLPSAADAERGFGPRSEQSIKLYFELKELKASGYHIAIFYP